MKKLLLICGILLILCGLALRGIGEEGVEASQPNEVHTGVIVDGEYKYVDSGYIGGSQEGIEAFGQLKDLGVVCIIAGGFFVVLSFFVRRPEDSPYL